MKFKATIKDAKPKAGKVQFVEIKLEAVKTPELWDYLGVFYDTAVEVELTGYEQTEFGDELKELAEVIDKHDKAQKKS